MTEMLCDNCGCEFDRCNGKQVLCNKPECREVARERQKVREKLYQRMYYKSNRKKIIKANTIKNKIDPVDDSYMRVCLRCDKDFFSSGKNNRICYNCKIANSYIKYTEEDFSSGINLRYWR